jgi:hypothetical protein
MGLQGLSKFKQKEEARKNKTFDSPFFTLEPGQKVRIRPLAEPDEDSPNYDEKIGTANFVTEFENPRRYWLRIVDTRDDEEGTTSVGWEMIRKLGWYSKEPDPTKNQHDDRKKNWNPKNRWYLPVVVDDGEQEPYVSVLQMTHGEKSWSQAFLDYFETKGSITDRWWDFERNNADPKKVHFSKVKYTLTPDDKSKLDTSKFEIPNVDDAPYVNNVPYEDQAEFLQIDETFPELNGNAQSEDREPALAGASTSSAADDENW